MPLHYFRNKMSENALLYKRICKQCKAWYREIDSIGRWQCAYHPGVFNADGPGEFHPQGTYECCGTAINPFLDNYRDQRNPNYNAKLLLGCTPKDHSSVQCLFTSIDTLQEREIPDTIINSDQWITDKHRMTNNILNGKPPTDGITFKGFHINEKKDLELRRFDEEKATFRSFYKHKGNTVVSKCIRIEHEGNIRNLILDKNTTIRRIMDGHLGLYDTDTYKWTLAEEKKAQPLLRKTTVKKLEEGKTYFTVTGLKQSYALREFMAII